MTDARHQLQRLQHRRQREKLHDFIVREMELGKRAAVLFGNEAEGWGPWVNTENMFEINLNPVTLQSDWTRNLEGVDPYGSRSPKRRPKPTAENPVFFPGQRQPSEPQTKRR